MAAASKRLIFDLGLQEVEELVATWGESGYRARQIWQGLYTQVWSSPKEFTILPVKLRQKLEHELEFSHLHPVTQLKSQDGETVKTLFRLPDGQAIESVLMRYTRRRTLCISTQAGCAMGCVFCATGQMGFRRNLTSGEIVEQVIYYARQLAEVDERVTNVVLMGMGEPFHNYDATMAAIDRLNDPEGYHLGARRFTLSTVGIVPMIDRFAAEHRQVNLAVSLHAIDDVIRDALIPVNRRYPVAQVLDACRRYIHKTNRRITFEWALIRDVNDSVETARKLAEGISDMLCHVNVIPLNPTQGYTGETTPEDRAQEFKAELERQGVPCTIRVRRGIEIQAGCGQLASQS